jgi:Flagellar basal body rod FlgEFG protein C-terminal
MDLVSPGYAGMADAIQRFETASADLAAPFSAAPEDRVGAMIQMIEAKTQFRASAAAVRVADQMMSALLEVQGAR